VKIVAGECSLYSNYLVQSSSLYGRSHTLFFSNTPLVATSINGFYWSPLCDGPYRPGWQMLMHNPLRISVLFTVQEISASLFEENRIGWLHVILYNYAVILLQFRQTRQTVCGKCCLLK